MFYGVINESYDYTEYLEMELENSLLFFKSLDIVQESGIQIVQESFSDIKEKIKDLWERFKEWAKGIIEKIKNFFGKFKKKSESNTEEKIVQSLQNPQVAPKGSGGVSDEEAEKVAKRIKDNWDKIEELQKENDKELDKLQNTKKDAANNISERHKEAQEIIKDALKNIYDVKISDENDKISNQIERDLNNLSKDDKSMSVEDVKEIIKKRVPSTSALPNNSKIFYIEDKGYDTEYMDFSEGCKKLLSHNNGDFNNFDKFPYYYHEARTIIDKQQQSFINTEDIIKMDKEVEDFFTKSFGAFYNASDDEIVIKQKPKESDVQKFARNLGDILVMTKQCASDTFNLSQNVYRKIHEYEANFAKYMKKDSSAKEGEYFKSAGDYDDAEGKHYDFGPSDVAKLIAKDIDNMKKYISLLYKIHSNCVKVYNYDINFAKTKMFSDQIRRLEGIYSNVPMHDDKFIGPAYFKPSGY